MCATAGGALAAIGKGFEVFRGPLAGLGTNAFLGGIGSLLRGPEIPEIKLPKLPSARQTRRDAAEKARLARIRAKGGFGHGDTRVTSPLGTPPPEPGQRSMKTLLGS